MPDISMCAGVDCPSRTSCWRYMAPPTQHRQAYGDFYLRRGAEDRCGYYWRMASMVAQAGVTRTGGDAEGGSVAEGHSTRSPEAMRPDPDPSSTVIEIDPTMTDTESFLADLRERHEECDQCDIAILVRLLDTTRSERDATLARVREYLEAHAALGRLYDTTEECKAAIEREERAFNALRAALTPPAYPPEQPL